jgi:hypothetical protein
MESKEVANFHRDWVTTQAEREALATKCLEAYFECGTNQIPELKRYWLYGRSIFKDSGVIINTPALF